MQYCEDHIGKDHVLFEIPAHAGNPTKGKPKLKTNTNSILLGSPYKSTQHKSQREESMLGRATQTERCIVGVRCGYQYRKPGYVRLTLCRGLHRERPWS